MEALRSDLALLISGYCSQECMNESPLDGALCMRLTRPSQRAKGCWGASLCIVAQGCKEITLGHSVYRSVDAHYIATPIDLPVISRVASASPEKPFLCLKISLDPLILGEVEAQMREDSPPETESSLRGIFVGDVSARMLGAAIRLVELFQTPDDARVLGPLVVREILYHLLSGTNGPAIRQYVRSGSAMHRISRAIYTLSTELSDSVDVDALARSANMSRSAFFKHFKDATSMSPIQYQKRLRLLEARRLMVDEVESAEGSAYRVGYRSASQFSREYSRVFGRPPSRDARRARHAVVL